MPCGCKKKKVNPPSLGVAGARTSAPKTRTSAAPPVQGRVSWQAIPPAGSPESPVSIYTISERNRWVMEHPDWKMETVLSS